MKISISKKFLLLLNLILFLLYGCSLFSNDKVVNEVANRFEVTPSWNSIRNQVLVELKPGLTRKEVHDILDKVGPWKMDLIDSPERGGWDPDTQQYLFRENMHFTEENTYKELGYWGFLYNKDDILIRGGSIDRY